VLHSRRRARAGLQGRHLSLRGRDPARRLVRAGPRFRSHRDRQPSALLQPLRPAVPPGTWRSINGETGNDIEVDLVPDIAILHEAGYHVLAYDLRNLGLSGDANGGVTERL
jgi:hypothetical protein